MGGRTTKLPVISVARAASIFEEMLSVRRFFCPADHDFFKMSDFWEDLCDEQGNWSVKTYKSKESNDLSRKAGVSAFAGRVTLTLDERLLENARSGCNFSNYVLAHEVGHVALQHFDARTKNFELSGPDGTWNLPASLEELEANLAAVFLQCGVALLDPRWGPLELANRAFSDENYVRKAQKYVRLEAFQGLLTRPKPKFDRVVL